MPPRLIAIDLDGTLLSSSGQISPRNRAALHLAQSSGAEIVVSTGRRHSFDPRLTCGLCGKHGLSDRLSRPDEILDLMGDEQERRTEARHNWRVKEWVHDASRSIVICS